MTRVMLWKEYRQQRAMALAIAFAALVLIYVLAQALHGKQTSGWEVYKDVNVMPVLFAVVTALTVVQGAVAGASLLASDKEDGTQALLDSLSGTRHRLFVNKLAAGVVITLAQSFFLIGLGLGFAPWQHLLWLPLVGLDGLLWGLLAGALCRTSLAAFLVSFALMFFNWILALPIVWIFQTLFGKKDKDFIEWPVVCLVGLNAGGAAYWIYCRSDFARKRQPTQRGIASYALSWLTRMRALWWLTSRQGWWILVGGTILSVFLGFNASLIPMVLWPIGMLVLGVTCGLAVFAFDQNDGVRFLGAQRFPAGRIWCVKILFWATAMLGLTAMALTLAAIKPPQSQFEISIRAVLEQWVRHWNSRRDANQGIVFHDTLGGPAWLLLIWPIYGFCVGQFFGQVTGRAIVGLILSLFVAFVTAGTWVPSLVFSGVPSWQILIVPITLLLATRLTMRPWMSGRLQEPKLVFALVGGAVLTTAALTGCLWYRAVEVPDVGEPFDVSEFRSQIAEPAQKEAGPSLTEAVAALARAKPPLREEPEPSQIQITPDLQEVLRQGWHDEKGELGRYLDLLFAPKPKAPLPADEYTNSYMDSIEAGRLFIVRALQLQSRGDSAAALRLLETTLGLSRLESDYVPGLQQPNFGYPIEIDALQGFQRWLEKVGPDKKLLRAGLAVLQRHQSEIPDLASAIKKRYLNRHVEVHGLLLQRTPFRQLFNLAYAAPWEKERQERIDRAITAGQLRALKQPLKRVFFDHWNATEMATTNGLPPNDGPGSSLTADAWGNFIGNSPMAVIAQAFPLPRMRSVRSQCAVRGIQLATALAEYQADHGAPPARLELLVPDYLAALPMDPYSGESFRYRISQGEEIRKVIPPVTLAPGQALVWIELDGSVAEQFRLVLFPVPAAKAKGRAGS